jgi:hypothetical protein
MDEVSPPERSKSSNTKPLVEGSSLESRCLLPTTGEKKGVSPFKEIEIKHHKAVLENVKVSKPLASLLLMEKETVNPPKEREHQKPLERSKSRSCWPSPTNRRKRQ